MILICISMITNEDFFMYYLATHIPFLCNDYLCLLPTFMEAFVYS